MDGTESKGEELLLDLNFVPQWARRPPDAQRFSRFDDADDASSRQQGRGRQGRRPRDEARGRPDKRRSSSPRSSANRRDDDPKSGSSGTKTLRSRQGVSGAEARQPEKPRHAQADHTVRSSLLKVRFLPERQALKSLIRRIRSSHRAYPLIDLASVMMAQEGCCFVKIEMAPEVKEQRLYQCRHCHSVALEKESLEQHVVHDHLDLFFTIEQQQVDKPSGAFVCVAKCGLTGAFLGPPNHHSYGENIKRIHAEKFASMALEDYRRRIKIVHDAEEVERWKEEASTVEVLRLIDHEDCMDRRAAGHYMREHVLPSSISAHRHVSLSESEAHSIQDREIRTIIRHEWQQENRFPVHLAFALRAALKHHGLFSFKSGGKSKGTYFVTAVRPSALDPYTAIEPIRDALLYLRQHPGCTRQEMVKDLRPDDDPASETVQALLQPIHWLVEKGHIIEFFNGTLSVPLA